jgi:hypothetical protein
MGSIVPPAVAGIAFFVLVQCVGPSAAAAQPRTLHAVKVTSALKLDGRLDETLYRDVSPISDFTQLEPREGEPATERTELWIAFDRENVYVTFRCFESRPDLVVAKDMRRDGSSWQGDDIVVFFFDTFNDKRNGYEFTINSIGGRGEGQTFNERNYVSDWNPVWEFATGRFEGGWIVETAIPFKSLRYVPGENQTWGFNAFRTNRWKNELSFVTPVSKARGQSGVQQASVAAQLMGMTAPASKNLEIKPYAISNTTGLATTGGRVTNDLTADAGVDLKYGVTENLTADFTYNTDFAQVEADQQQVNLTRFSLFFPEKRDFFLENQGTFVFGTVSQGFGANAGETPILFYSRRIGLEDGRVVPIDGGGRLTGRVGRYTIGVLDIQTGRQPLAAARPTNFSVVRLKRDIFRRSSVGLIATGRKETEGGVTDNAVYGLDSLFAFFDNLSINTYWARSIDSRILPRRSDESSRRRVEDETSYRAHLDYAGDRYGLQLEHLLVGDRFNPGMGYVRRTDMRRSFGQARFSPRPRAGAVRKYSWTASTGYIENTRGRLETREHEGEFGIEFQNADRFTVSYNNTYEFLPAPFRIATGVAIPTGGYSFDTVRLGFARAQRRRVSGNVQVEHGTFYNGRKTSIGVSNGRVNFTPQLSVEPTYSVNRVDLAPGEFTTHLAGSRVTYTMTPFMFASAFLQYNSGTHSMSANVRLRWEYRPGSELFVVYNDERDTLARGFPDLSNRAFIVKVNRLFRF